MDRTEQQVIDELFGKINQAEAQSGPRDPDAERYIGQHIGHQPAAPYYMAQAIVIQEQALNMAMARVQELEQELRSRPAGGGFLGGLFGGGGMGRTLPPPDTSQQAMDPRIAPYTNRGYAHSGGGFLGGAMQTAIGVAGGVLLGNALMGMFSAGEAMAAEAPPEEDTGIEDDGGFMDGDEF
jgi:hypothetical protein